MHLERRWRRQGALGTHAYGAVLDRTLANNGNQVAACRRLEHGAKRSSHGHRSLADRRLPQLYLVSFRIDDPGKLPVLGIVDLLENVAAFFA